MTSPVCSHEELIEYSLFLRELADETRSLVLELWARGDLETNLKDDKTPVTQVDLLAEKFIRERIAAQFPSHGVIGEEFPPTLPDSPFQWTVDPIDGTQNLLNRIPTFGTLLGLRIRNEAVLGMIDHPALDLRTIGGRGLGVFQNGRALSYDLTPQGSLSENDLLATNTASVFGRAPSMQELFFKVLDFHPQQRIYYDCYAHTLAASGSLAVVLEPNLKIWDLTPIEVFLKELGGAFLPFEVPGGSPSGCLNAIFGKPWAVIQLAKHLQLKDIPHWK